MLNRVKLIAEPWDVGPGGYRLGGFPPPWREWNDRYRDAVRDFWLADANLQSAMTGTAGTTLRFESAMVSPEAGDGEGH